MITLDGSLAVKKLHTNRMAENEHQSKAVQAMVVGQKSTSGLPLGTCLLIQTRNTAR